MLSNVRKVKFEGILACPDCFSSVEYSGSNFICVGCGKSYLEQEEKIYFHGIGNNKLFSTEASGGKDSLLLFLKSFAKKWPSFFLLLYKIAAPFTGQAAEKFVEQFQDNDIILNIGSGSKVIGKDVINVDYDSFPSVQVVADINKLPFMSNAVDAVVSESVFEHLSAPEQTVAEIFRILKPGGKLYVVVPFMLGYHASPSDYYRWTEYGMKKMLNNFNVEEVGIAWGPTTAMTSVAGAWLALILSFGSKTLYQAWLVFFIFFFALINRLDHLLKYHPRAIDNAHGLYFVAVKK